MSAPTLNSQLSTLNSCEYGFRVGRYDRRRPLILDPAQIISAGYIGGVEADYGRAVAVDDEPPFGRGSLVRRGDVGWGRWSDS